MGDRTGTFEATLFPRVYEKYAPRTLTKGPYLVTGEIDVTLGSPTLNVRQIELLPAKPNTGSPAGKVHYQELHQCNTINRFGSITN